MNQIYIMSGYTNVLAFPQIYNNLGINAYEWDYFILYTRLNNYYPPFVFAGALTQSEACKENYAIGINDCYLGQPGGTDNTPEQGWSQLYYAINDPADPRTFQNNLPFSSVMSWNHLKVELTP